MLSIPHVHFQYSDIYDIQWRLARESTGSEQTPYPSTDKVRRFMKRLEREWRKQERPVLASIAKTTGFLWKDRREICYVVGSGSPFSDPLTIPMFSSQAPTDYVADVLAHELIHRNLLADPFVKRWPRVLSSLEKAFPGETENTLIHVLVHAVHAEVFLEVFDEKRLAREKRIMNEFAEYRRAWKIVERVGSRELVRKYIRGRK